MKIGDRVRVKSVYPDDTVLGIKEGCEGVVKKVSSDLIWVEFDDPDVYNKIETIRKAVAGLFCFSDLMPDTMYIDEIHAFCLTESQVEVVCKFRRGDIVQLCNMSEGRFADGDVGIVCECSGSRIKLKMYENGEYWSVWATEDKLKSTGLNAYMF